MLPRVITKANPMLPHVLLEEREKSSPIFSFTKKSFVNLYQRSPMVFNTIKTFNNIATFVKVCTFRSSNPLTCNHRYLWCSDVVIANISYALMLRSLIYLNLPYVIYHIPSFLRLQILETLADHIFWSRSPFSNFHILFKSLFRALSNGEGLM